MKAEKNSSLDLDSTQNCFLIKILARRLGLEKVFVFQAFLLDRNSCKHYQEPCEKLLCIMLHCNDTLCTSYVPVITYSNQKDQGYTRDKYVFLKLHSTNWFTPIYLQNMPNWFKFCHLFPFHILPWTCQYRKK